MNGKIPENILDEIQHRVDIVHLINEYVPLKKAGRSFKGLCPFHQEKTPSFHVNPDRQIYKCFGCGESGNIFGFLMKYEGLNFPQAVERLAKSVGVELPDRDKDAGARRDINKVLYQVMRSAQQVYQSALLNQNGETARKYLEKRGIGTEQIKEYGLGWAPDSWDFLTGSGQRLSIEPKLLESAGLAVRKATGSGYYDRMRNRIIIPIREHREGRIVALGGRTLGDDPAKYLNTPETPIYHKGRLLYGLREGLEAIRKKREVIVVEGYFDRISMASAGFSNSVASCGTALTADHIRLLKQSALKIFLLFDPDIAGMTAAKRALEGCLVAGIDTMAVLLPEGRDPDDVVRVDGPAAIQELLKRGMSGLDFLIKSTAKRYNLNTAHGRREAVEEMLPFLASVENSIDQGVYISRIASLIDIPDTSVLELYRRSIRKRQRGTRQVEPEKAVLKKAQIDSRERDFFIFLLNNMDYLKKAVEIIPEKYLITADGRALYALIIKSSKKNDQFTVSRLINQIDNEILRRFVVDLSIDTQSAKQIKGKSADILELLSLDFKLFHLKISLENNGKKLREPGLSQESVNQVLMTQMELSKEIKELMAYQSNRAKNIAFSS